MDTPGGEERSAEAGRQSPCTPICAPRIDDAGSMLRGGSHPVAPAQLSASRHRRRQIADSYEVVGRHREREDPLHDRTAPMAQLARSATVFSQPKISSIRLRFT